MAKRRSSLKGRGSEILFGDPQTVDLEPLAAEPSPVNTGPPDGGGLAETPPISAGDTGAISSTGTEPTLDDPELEMALREEALAGQIDPAEEKKLAALDTEPPPTPEMEHAFFQEAVVAEEPPEPVAETPVPTLEETMEEQEQTQEMALHEPPPPEVSDVTADILPPKPTPKPFDMGAVSLTQGDIQEPEKKEEELELPEGKLTPEEEKALLARWGSVRIKKLDEEIGKVYEQVLSKVGENEDLANHCYNFLLKARDILLRREATRIPQAEYYIEQVRARLKRAEESERGAKKYAWWIFGWGALWGVAFIAVLILLNFDWFHNIVVPAGTTNNSLTTDIFVQAMIWGGIGGVAAVWYSLFKHVGNRDFDTQFNITYVGKPFLGLILGATVYMVFTLLIRTLGILPAGVQGIEGVDSISVAPWIIYLMSWACGFKENRIFELVDRAMKRVFSSEEAAEPAALPPTATPTQPAA
jgi:hypothetical protein